MDLDEYLDALASAAPTPGGGSAAAVAGALGAALLAMVARITCESPRPVAAGGEAREIVASADAARAGFRAAGPDDEAAYAAVVAAQALPRATAAEKAERTARLQAALAAAAEAPLRIAEASARTMEIAARAAALDNRNLMSDVDCAVRFLRAAFEAAAANVRVNHAYLRDAALIATQSRRLADAAAALAEAERRATAFF